MACEDVALTGDTATESVCGINHAACSTPGHTALVVAGHGGVGVGVAISAVEV